MDLLQGHAVGDVDLAGPARARDLEADHRPAIQQRRRALLGHSVAHGGDLVEADTYNKMFTMHGIIMVFLVVIPGIPTIIGNFFLPILIGDEAKAVLKYLQSL